VQKHHNNVAANKHRIVKTRTYLIDALPVEINCSIMGGYPNILG
jgi:hypothetical protein